MEFVVVLDKVQVVALNKAQTEEVAMAMAVECYLVEL